MDRSIIEITPARLPEAFGKKCGPVRCWSEPIPLPTYLPMPPDKNPMFLEKRVYQGSSGKVYPLPFIDRISVERTMRSWQALHIENDFLRVMILPELGGRIHALVDKTNGYDLIYRQETIKPALVGLTGPWISGGIEFNWPQHHRPATFLPVDWQIENHADGSATIWCGDHDPLCRMKGMHGVCLYPDRAVLELKVRAYNRTGFVQTFLWWANVATRVHEGYQSFFPPDVYYVADHARRSTTSYPLANGFYYGIDYGRRGRKGIPPREVPAQFIPPHCLAASEQNKQLIPRYAPNDLSFYANIPTPCSYMCMGSQADFFGGYDHLAQAGIVHVANHHISPGKKQWTWGNHDFGYAWDRNLTEKDGKGEYGPYIEIMAGVYTDNQPDFSFLQPGETKTWSQFWYPIQKIGPVQNANENAAVSLRVSSESISIGIVVTRKVPAARFVLKSSDETIFEQTADLVPGQPVWKEIPHPKANAKLLSLRIFDQDGNEIIAYQPRQRKKTAIPPPADEPAAPENMQSADELFLTGLHLEQYRHATRCPTLYWREALKRDPLDCRCNNAIGLWHLRRGEFEKAETHFRRSIRRLTRRNANPYDGEAYYNLGMCLWYQSDLGPERSDEEINEAYAAFYKSTWNHAWASAAYHAIAEIDCRRSHWQIALDHLNRSLRLNSDNLRARNLNVMALRKLGRDAEADAILRETLSLDSLDGWARWLRGDALKCDLQSRLDLSQDLHRAGFTTEAIAVLKTEETVARDWPNQSWGAAPLVHYTLGWLHEKLGDTQAAASEFQIARALPPAYCFPARLEEIGILESAIRADPRDSNAPYYLGNLLYDRRRHDEAITHWEKSAKLQPSFPTVWRNLGIGYFNVRKNATKSRTAYDKAFRADPNDARLLYERDQLWKRMAESPAKRISQLEKHANLVARRDDLSVEFCALLNQLGRHDEALKVLSERTFQPWEGGEGGPLGQHVRTHLMLGQKALLKNDFPLAAEHFQTALTAPLNLGEARHILANQSDILYSLGIALDRIGDRSAARKHWKSAADFKGDFQQMSVRAFSEMTYYSALAMQRLGRKSAAKKLLRDLLKHAMNLATSEAKIDYFATSLPTMLLFDDELQYRQETTALFLQAQAHLGLGKRTESKKLLTKVLRRDPNHALAADLLTEIRTTRNA